MDNKELIFLDGPAKDMKAAILDDGFSPFVIVPFSVKGNNGVDSDMAIDGMGSRVMLYAKYIRQQSTNDFTFSYSTNNAEEYLFFKNLNGQ